MTETWLSDSAWDWLRKYKDGDYVEIEVGNIRDLLAAARRAERYEETLKEIREIWFDEAIVANSAAVMMESVARAALEGDSEPNG